MGKSENILKVKFAVYVQNGGDGSASARFFTNEELAEEVAERDVERFGEDVATHEFEINLLTGEIVSGIETSSDDDDDA